MKAPKLYFTDNGILNTLGEIDSGVQFENSIACQLRAKSAIKYYSRKTGREIDFLVKQSAIEVKETPALLDLKKLKELSRPLAISKNYIVFRHPPKRVEKNFSWGGDVR